MSEDIARSPQTKISVAKRCQNGGSTSGAMTSSTTTTPNPIQYPTAGDLAARLASRSFGRRDEEPRGPEEHRQDQHDERDDHRLRGAHDDGGVALEEADEDRGQDRAAEVAHATDDDHDERAQREVEAHRRWHGQP